MPVFPKNTRRFKTGTSGTGSVGSQGKSAFPDPYHRQGRQPLCCLMLTVVKKSPDELALFQAFEPVRRFGRHSPRRGSAVSQMELSARAAGSQVSPSRLGKPKRTPPRGPGTVYAAIASSIERTIFVRGYLSAAPPARSAQAAALLAERRCPILFLPAWHCW